MTLKYELFILNDMGMTDVTLTIKNTLDSSKIAKDDFLVDSGAAYTVIPAKIVKKLGLTPNFYRDFVLADGEKVKRPVGSAVIGYGSEEIASPVVLGKEGDSPLLGALTLARDGNI